MHYINIKEKEGPIALVMCPTRELAVQIEKEVYRFGSRKDNNNK